MGQIRFTLLAMSLFFSMAGCGADDKGNQEDNHPECVADWQCQGGRCIAGQCEEFRFADSESDGSVPTGDVKDNPDGSADEDLEEPADTTSDANPPPDVSPQPDVVKPSGGPDILVDPTAHMFTFIPGVVNPASMPVLIYNQGQTTLKIDKIYWEEGSSPEFSFMALPPLPSYVEPFKNTAVTVIFKESSPHGPATLVIESNDADTPVAKVQFTSQAKTAEMPCIQLQPSSLNFGQVVRGDSKPLPFKIINCSGSTVLNITSVVRSSFFGMPLTAEFQMNPQFPTPSVLGANQALDWEMVYSPGLAGVDSGYFTFKSNDPQQPEAKLNVNGVGVPPPLEEIGLHIEMEWDVDNSDVDLHLIAPGGEFFDCDTDCHFGNPSPDWGTPNVTLDDPFLDYDDVDGFGPENINLSEPTPGTYKVLLHYYNDSYDSWTGGATDCIVRIYSYNNLVAEYGPVKLDQTNRNWDVCLVEWPSLQMTTLGNTYMVSSSDINACLPFF